MPGSERNGRWGRAIEVFVVSEKNGHWRQEIEVPGLSALATGGGAHVGWGSGRPEPAPGTRNTASARGGRAAPPLHEADRGRAPAKAKRHRGPATAQIDQLGAA